jgi:hypothetical protein
MACRQGKVDAFFTSISVTIAQILNGEGGVKKKVGGGGGGAATNTSCIYAPPAMVRKCPWRRWVCYWGFL